MSLTADPLEQRPRLSRAARLRYDAPTRSYVLLAPERGLRLNDTASEIVQRCTGEFTVKQIAAEVFSACRGGASSSVPSGQSAAEPTVDEVTQDILDLLVELRQRQLLFFDSVL